MIQDDDLIKHLKESADRLNKNAKSCIACREKLLVKYSGLERMEKELELNKIFHIDSSNSFVEQLKKYYGVEYEPR